MGFLKLSALRGSAKEGKIAASNTGIEHPQHDCKDGAYILPGREAVSDEKEATDASYLEQAPSATNVTPTSPQLERALTRKLDLHLLPWLFGLWLLAFIDRSNIGNANIDGLTEDLKLSGTDFNAALAIFYVPYILVDVPSNLILKKLGGGNYLPALMIAWGLVGTCIGAVKDFSGLLATRFFLGLCEGGLLGGMVLYLSMFYTRGETLWRIGVFYCAAPLSGAFGGLLATGLAEIHYGGYNRWPWIFFVEGAITILFGILAAAFMPHTPATARFLSPELKRMATERLQLDAQGTSKDGDVNTEHFDWKWVRMALLNVNTVLLSLNFFAIITPIYSFSLFLPAIIKSLGYSSVKAQLFTVPPNMAGFFAVLIGTSVSDRIKSRGIIMIVGCSLAIVGYIMLLVEARPLVHYGG